MTREDQRLIEGLIQGKESDWQALFASHYPFMCYLADQYVHDEYLAAALASDVFSHLWEIRKTVHIDRSLRSYLLRATRNRSFPSAGYFSLSRRVTKVTALPV